jgi:hypothetical protein
VLEWSASETASALDLTVAAANSALQRARATLRQQLPEHPDEWSAADPSAEERALLERFIDAHERASLPSFMGRESPALASCDHAAVFGGRHVMAKFSDETPLPARGRIRAGEFSGIPL